MNKHLKKSGKSLLVMTIFLSSLTSCHNRASTSDDIPIVGLDKEGKSILRHVPRSRVFKKLGNTMNDITEESTKKLEGYHFTKGFELSRVTVGLGIVAEFGIDDIAEIEFSSSFELRLEQLPVPKPRS